MMKVKKNDIFYKRILMQLINMLVMEQRGGYGNNLHETCKQKYPINLLQLLVTLHHSTITSRIIWITYWYMQTVTTHLDTHNLNRITAISHYSISARYLKYKTGEFLVHFHYTLNK